MDISVGSKILIKAAPETLPNDDYRKYVNKVCTVYRITNDENFYIKENVTMYFYKDEIKLIDNCIYSNDLLGGM